MVRFDGGSPFARLFSPRTQRTIHQITMITSNSQPINASVVMPAIRLYSSPIQKVRY